MGVAWSLSFFFFLSVTFCFFSSSTLTPQYPIKPPGSVFRSLQGCVISWLNQLICVLDSRLLFPLPILASLSHQVDRALLTPASQRRCYPFVLTGSLNFRVRKDLYLSTSIPAPVKWLTQGSNSLEKESWGPGAHSGNAHPRPCWDTRHVGYCWQSVGRIGKLMEWVEASSWDLRFWNKFSVTDTLVSLSLCSCRGSTCPDLPPLACAGHICGWVLLNLGHMGNLDAQSTWAKAPKLQQHLTELLGNLGKEWAVRRARKVHLTNLEDGHLWWQH